MIILSFAIEASGLTQYGLGLRVVPPIPETRMSRIVNGRLIPTAEERRAIAALLEVPEDVLFSVPATPAAAAALVGAAWR